MKLFNAIKGRPKESENENDGTENKEETKEN